MALPIAPQPAISAGTQHGAPPAWSVVALAFVALMAWALAASQTLALQFDGAR